MEEWTMLIPTSRYNMNSIIGAMEAEIDQDMYWAFDLWRGVLESDDIWKTDPSYTEFYIDEILSDFIGLHGENAYRYIVKTPYFMEQIFQNVPVIGSAQYSVIFQAHECGDTIGIEFIKIFIAQNPRYSNSVEEVMLAADQYRQEALEESSV